MKALGSDLCMYCWAFLDLQAIARLEAVCRTFHALLNSQSGGSLFETIDLSCISDPSPLWLLRTALVFRPKGLILQGCELEKAVLLTLLKEVGPGLAVLDLSFTTLNDQDVAVATAFCSQLEELRVDKRCEEDRTLQRIITSLPLLRRLSLRYNSFLKGRPLLSSALTLESLSIEECQHFDYAAVYALASRSTQCMTSLSIDGEAYSTQEVCALVALLPRLTAFSVCFAGELSDPLLAALKGHQLRKLYIKKGALLTSAAFQDLFSVAYPALEVLDLIECAYLDDLSLLQIAPNCPSLHSLNLSWCTEVTDEGVVEVVRHCSRLRHMELVGLKCVTDQAFPLDEDLPIYDSLLSVNFTKSDYVSDDHLQRISSAYPQIQLKNYYGEGKGNWRCSH